MADLGAGRKRARLYCEHCKESVSHSTYYRHRSKYYDEVANAWCRDDEQVDSEDSEGSIAWNQSQSQDIVEPEVAFTHKQIDYN